MKQNLIREKDDKEKLNLIKQTPSDINSNTEDKLMIDKFINSIFKDKFKKKEIIEKLRPFFSLKIIPQKEIDKVYSAIETIDPDKIDLIEEFKYEEEKYDSTNLFETKSKSVGLSSTDLNFAVTIFKKKQSIDYGNKEENESSNFQKNNKFYCIHSIFVSLFRIVIDFKEIKLSKQLFEGLKEIENANDIDKKDLLENLIEKFGLFIPLELLIGGRINFSFDANNAEDKREYHSILQKQIKAKFGGGNKWISADLNFNNENNKEGTDNYQSLSKIENLSKKMIGGNYLYKDDLKNWIQSFNIDNLQIIEYKTLMPIYYFIQGLETKLSICLQKSHEEIVIQKIYSLMEEYKIEEKNIFEGSSENCNLWKVGLTKDNFKSFTIYKKRISKTLFLQNSKEKKENIVKDVICDEIPDGFIICGWIIKTNANSKPYDVISTWSRRKELPIIGESCFKFKISSMYDENNEFDENFEIEWRLEIFCIHSDFLIPYSSINKNYSEVDEHYFSNCDCDIKLNNLKDSNVKCKYIKIKNKPIRQAPVHVENIPIALGLPYSPAICSPFIGNIVESFKSK